MQHKDGPMLILAGPGSGKTRVVTHRIAYLMEQGIGSDEILALTFTNKAALEMSVRLETLLNMKSHVWIGTYHRFCAQFLRQHASRVGLDENYTIYDSQQSLRVLRSAITLSGCEMEYTTLDKLGRMIADAKSKLIMPDHVRSEHHSSYLDDIRTECLRQVYPVYQELLRQANAADFNDLLFLTAIILREHGQIRAALDQQYKYILVDEYQDTNMAQYAIVRSVSMDYPNLVVTGDPDQSIYAWRGAVITNILEFEKDFPDAKVVRLEKNYRSTNHILRAADSLIQHNVYRKEKELYTDNPEGVPVRLTRYDSPQDEAAQIAMEIRSGIQSGRYSPSDYAVFYRMNALSVDLETALRCYDVPYQIIQGTEFFQRTEVCDMLAYLRLLHNPHDNEAFLRVINVPARGIGKTTLGHLQKFAWNRHVSLFDAVNHAEECTSLKKRGREAVLAFRDTLLNLYHATPNFSGITELLEMILEMSQYRAFLSRNDEVDAQKNANLDQLLAVAAEFDLREKYPRLETFLENISLVNDTDDWDAEQHRVSLMTLHSAKGLEFPVVYMTALEQGILPHELSKDQPEQMEEERRLMFVGITRAKKELRLSFSSARQNAGGKKISIPSPFLLELPLNELHLCGMEKDSLKSCITPQKISSRLDHDADQWDGVDEIDDSENYGIYPEYDDF